MSHYARLCLMFLKLFLLPTSLFCYLRYLNREHRKLTISSVDRETIIKFINVSPKYKKFPLVFRTEIIAYEGRTTLAMIGMQEEVFDNKTDFIEYIAQIEKNRTLLEQSIINGSTINITNTVTYEREGRIINEGLTRRYYVSNKGEVLYILANKREYLNYLLTYEIFLNECLINMTRHSKKRR
jgi:hypothetical protein